MKNRHFYILIILFIKISAVGLILRDIPTKFKFLAMTQLRFKPVYRVLGKVTRRSINLRNFTQNAEFIASCAAKCMQLL